MLILIFLEKGTEVGDAKMEFAAPLPVLNTEDDWEALLASSAGKDKSLLQAIMDVARQVAETLFNRDGVPTRQIDIEVLSESGTAYQMDCEVDFTPAAAALN